MSDHVPSMSFTLKELAKAAGMSKWALRHYFANRYLPRPELHGMHTRYTELHFYSIAAIARLRVEGLQMRGIVQRLKGKTVDEIAVIAGLMPPPEPEPPPPPAPPPPSPSPSSSSSSSSSISSSISPSTPGPYRFARAEHWERIVLGPGVELHVASSADGEAWRVAREIEAAYAVRASSGSA